LTRRWTEFAAARKAYLATLALLILQLGGCVVDLVSEQATLMAGFCIAVPGDSVLEWVGSAVWVVLCLSWLAGLVALRVPPLRPLYWGLIAAIPIAWAAQNLLLHRHLLFCDAP
jgi:hypothetical protein